MQPFKAVKGFEFLTFEQANANQAASDAAMLPFTRNAFAPMYFTLMVFSEIPGIDRVTRNGLEIAESVIFMSSLQHFAATPEGMKTVPEYARHFLRSLPVVWEDTRFITGYPGKLIILARKAEGRWYIAGLNGENKTKSMEIDLSFLKEGKELMMITDGEDQFSFVKKSVEVPA